MKQEEWTNAWLSKNSMHITSVCGRIFIHGLLQEIRNSIADALELNLSCTNLSICECNSLWYIAWQFDINKRIAGCGDVLRMKYWNTNRVQYIIRYRTQHNTFEGETLSTLRTYERHPYIALSGELWVSFVIFLEKSYREIGVAHCNIPHLNVYNLYNVPHGNANTRHHANIRLSLQGETRSEI